MATSTNQMSIEQLTSIFGAETAAVMFAQMNNASSGSKAPFPFLKKVAVHGTELGNFGDFVYGTTYEKDASGERQIVDKGTNIGTEFEMVIVNVVYRYTKWDAINNKSLRSNMFTDLKAGIAGAVDISTGAPLPSTKDEKKAEGWKLNKIITGLVRADSKSPWTSVTFEANGKLYFTLGELTNNMKPSEVMGGVLKLSFKLESKGSTQYSVVDVEKSSVAPLPKDFWTNEEITSQLSAITSKMKEYADSQQYSGASATPSASAPSAPAEDNTDW